uniref:Uncharacterized protein n=1 Tax=Pithovirus LCPAC401 TaxID=2506595 RepID=A0A481Z982_9VIRU|nr:MAG: uncharacterized protein LCPAC401_00760 [Pithovirus LCPAC401]
MECKCDALGIVTENGGKYVEELLELFYSLKQEYYTTCFKLCEKPCPRWIWSDLEIRDALAIVSKDGKYFEPRFLSEFSPCCKKPSPIWIWSDLAKAALMEGLANTDMLKFIESKKIDKYYYPDCLEDSAAAGHLGSVQHIFDYGLNPIADCDCDWEKYEKFESVVIRMWKSALEKAVNAGYDSGELFEYLKLMVKISEIDADIDFFCGKISNIPNKSGVSELKMILQEKSESVPDGLRKIRERNYHRSLSRALLIEYESSGDENESDLRRKEERYYLKKSRSSSIEYGEDENDSRYERYVYES